MEYFKMILTALLGTVGFAIIFRLRGSHIAAASLGGALTFIVYAIFDSLGANLFVSNFIASLFAVLFAGVMARVLKTPSTILVSLCIIPLVPGSSLFYTMSNLIVWNQANFSVSAQNTLQVALGIAGGIVLESAVVHLLSHIRKKPTAPIAKQ